MPMCRSMCGHVNASLIWIDGCRLCLANTCHLPIMLRLADKLDAEFSKYPKPMGCTSCFINNSGYLGKNQGRVTIVTLTHLEWPGRGHNPPHSWISTCEDSQLQALFMWNIELIWFLWSNQQQQMRNTQVGNWEILFLWGNHRNLKWAM
jgi:hypothetical protein